MSEVERYWIDPSRLVQEGWHQDDTCVVKDWAYDRVVAERDALQQLLNQRDEQVESLKLQPPGEQVACLPVERCYEVRAKMIIAFNEAKKAGGDLDDALDAAYKSALRYSPNPMSAEQPAPVAVVVPERFDLPHRDEFESADHYAAATGEAKSWNACLDELKRLDPSM